MAAIGASRSRHLTLRQLDAQPVQPPRCRRIIGTIARGPSANGTPATDCGHSHRHAILLQCIAFISVGRPGGPQDTLPASNTARSIVGALSAKRPRERQGRYLAKITPSPRCPMPDHTIPDCPVADCPIAQAANPAWAPRSPHRNCLPADQQFPIFPQSAIARRRQQPFASTCAQKGLWPST